MNIHAVRSCASRVTRRTACGVGVIPGVDGEICFGTRQTKPWYGVESIYCGPGAWCTYVTDLDLPRMRPISASILLRSPQSHLVRVKRLVLPITQHTPPAIAIFDSRAVMGRVPGSFRGWNVCRGEGSGKRHSPFLAEQEWAEIPGHYAHILLLATRMPNRISRHDFCVRQRRPRAFLSIFLTSKTIDRRGRCCGLPLPLAQ